MKYKTKKEAEQAANDFAILKMDEGCYKINVERVLTNRPDKNRGNK